MKQFRMTTPLALALALALSLVAVGAAAHGRHGGGAPVPFSGPRMERWLADLPDDLRGRATVILEDARPALQDLHHRIFLKMEELRGLSFAGDTPPETLARLGMELQDLRDRLREGYRGVRERFRLEVGVEPPPSKKHRGHRGMRQFGM